MTDERADPMLEILKGIRTDVAAMKRERASQVTTIYGIRSDVADLKTRVDRIERRLGHTDTEH